MKEIPTMKKLFPFLFIILPSLCFTSLNAPISEKKPHNQTVDHHHGIAMSGPHHNTLKDPSQAFVEISKNAIPAVVFIKVENGQPEYDPRGGGQDPFDFFSDEFFNRFFGGPNNRQRTPPPPQISQGSGFIVSTDGYIVTNYHIIRDAKNITVSLQNGMERELSASLVGADPQTDIAVVKIDETNGKQYSYLTFGNSDDVETGEWVLAIGNPFELEATVTHGIISAKGRQNLQITDYEDFIQTDAPINPGNSGGPLLNLNGEVIGINTAIVSKSGGNMGIGFAIPSNMAKNIKTQIIEKGTVTRGFLGVSLQPIDRDLAEAFNLNKTEGALVADVVTKSPADKAGIMQGDIILKLNENPVRSPTTLRNDVLLLKPGTLITLTINRKGEILNIPVTLESHSSQINSESEVSKQLGISVDNLNPDTIQKYRLSSEDSGVVIIDVQPGTIGAKAGLRPGMLIMGINHKKITNVKEFNEAFQSTSDSKRVLLLIRLGDGTMRFISLKTE